MVVLGRLHIIGFSQPPTTIGKWSDGIKLSEAMGPRLSEGMGSKLSEPMEPKFSEGIGPKWSGVRESKLSEVIGAKLNEGME